MAKGASGSNIGVPQDLEEWPFPSRKRRAKRERKSGVGVGTAVACVRLANTCAMPSDARVCGRLGKFRAVQRFIG